MSSNLFDVIIIGAGVIGCAAARELSRSRLRVAVLEKAGDLAMGTTKANSAIVHAGYDTVPGTMKAKMNLAGNGLFDALSKELDFPFIRNGSLVLGFDADSTEKLEVLLRRGVENGVQGLKLLSKEQARAMEPNIGDSVTAALYAPSGGIVCPYEMTIALGENAAVNGVEFLFGRAVTSIEKVDSGFEVQTPDESFRTRLVVNAAGVFADDINNMVSQNKLHIIPRSGQYFLLDRAVGALVQHTLFQLPSALGKGVLVTPTVDGNLLIGPTAEDVEDKRDVGTTAAHFRQLVETAGLTLGTVPTREMITAFTGLRAHSVDDDFIIGEAPDVSGFINAAGIESPGLTSAPAIGIEIARIVREKLDSKPNPDFVSTRKGIIKFRELTDVQRDEMIAADPRYGRIVCRCEAVTEGEIVDSIHRPLGARDIDGVKRRTRAGMGRCQGGFCSPTVLEIIARERAIPLTQVTKSGGESYVLCGKNKELEVRGDA